MSAPRTGLLKVLGVAFGVAMLVGNTIGSGILRTPGDVAGALPSSTWFIGVWIVGGLYAMLGAMSVAELGVMIPKSGGQYVFARRALGEYPAFVVGWTDWVSSCAATAAGAIALGELCKEMAPTVVRSDGAVMTIGLASIVIFTAIQWIGVRSGDRSQQLLSLLKVLALLGVAVACLMAPGAPASTTVPVIPTGTAFVTALVFVFQNVLYTYDGWTGVIYFSGEMKDPSREIPRSMMLGVVTVLAVYLTLNAAFLHVLGITHLANEKFAAAAAAKLVFGATGEFVVRLVMAVTLLGIVNAVLMISSRVPYAMSEDRLLPRAMGRVNVGGTPVVALAVSSILTIALVLSGTFDQALALAAFFYVLQYAISFTSLFVLRVREPDTPRPFRVPGYPIVPGIVLLGALAFIVGSFFGDRVNSIHSVLVLAGSLVVYTIIKLSTKRATQ